MSSKSRMKRGKGSRDSWIVSVYYLTIHIKLCSRAYNKLVPLNCTISQQLQFFFYVYVRKFFLHPFVACKEKFTACVIIPLHDHCCMTSRVLSGELMQFLAKSQYAILTIYHLLNSPEVKMCSIIACISRIDGFNLCLNC